MNVSLCLFYNYENYVVAFFRCFLKCFEEFFSVWKELLKLGIFNFRNFLKTLEVMELIRNTFSVNWEKSGETMAILLGY